MRKCWLTLGLIFLFGITQKLNAQTFTLTGKILDAVTRTPLGGSTVRAGANSTVSNEEGNFSIQAKVNDVLTITHVGYEQVSMKITNQEALNIVMDQIPSELQQIVMIGTRRAGRIKTETPVPVDVVNVAQNTLPTAKMDLTSVLNFAAPSFNYNKQSGSDGADHVDLATLRGLGPDQTLVLVNGKRRHQTAFVSVFGTRGRGNSGTDLNAIPVDAIDRVEILRDGASAQYGSDAIAGVINLVLKKDVKKFSAEVGVGTYLDDKYNTYKSRATGDYPYQSKYDGTSLSVGANYGLPVGTKGGYLDISGNFLSTGKTFRQEQDGILPINYVRRANGEGSLTSGGVFLNFDAPATATTHIYAFGGYNYKKSDAFAFTRSWAGKPERFPTHADGSLDFVPSIMYRSSDGDTVYSPHIQTRITDASLAIGIKGAFGTGWTWDFSNAYGRNDFHFYGDKTFNAGLGSARTHFDDGGFNFAQNTVNLNFVKDIPTIASGFTLSFGAEYRNEHYKIYRGEEASYANYDTLKASGSQGYPGYQPADVVNANRNVFGFYGDAEIDVTKQFLLDGAIRIENYSDFGWTSNYKLAARYKVTKELNVRGSVSTGFRAPSLQQINFSNTFTTVQGGGLTSEVKIAPNYSTLAKAAGIDPLTQEKSVNASLGFSWKPVRDLTVTIDGYWVQVKDRVVLSGQFSADDPTLDPALIAEMNALHVGLAQFFANAVNTTNTGIDVVLDYNKALANKQSIRLLFTGNFQNMTIDQINVPAKLAGTEDLRKTFLSDREQAFILASAPKTKYAINAEYRKDWLTVGVRVTRFGKLRILGYGESGTGVDPMVPSDADPSVFLPDVYNYNGKTVTDLYFGFRLKKYATLYVGADNIFNVHPDLGYVPGALGWAFNNETGGPWDAVQMGGNGTRLFARLAFSF